MLITETIEIAGSKMIHNYSDNRFYVKRIDDDFLYEEAYDPIEFKDTRIYEETSEKIPDPYDPYIAKTIQED